MNSKAAISIQNVSKKYSLGVAGADTLRDKIASKLSFKKSVGEEFWALRDLSVDIQIGDVYGIIGKNGAGKSTLLKLISRITYPTSGFIQIKGKVASLLEVGTGFHPELTGRENIFLNGSILGMTRADISLKFDEIVAFSGVEKFLDTPVEHYSSGMYVRLAFAVAAHLEPEILIIDEVLSVGDSDFQKKCLGRMKTVSEEGRTVVFVSHNLSAVRLLCNKSVVLSKGQLVFDGSVEGGVAKYMENSVKNNNQLKWVPDKAIGNKDVKLHEIFITPESGGNTLELGDAFSISFKLKSELPLSQPANLSFILSTSEGEHVLMTSSLFQRKEYITVEDDNSMLFECQFPKYFLNEGVFVISKLLFFTGASNVLIEEYDIFSFEIFFKSTTVFGLEGRRKGMIRPLLNWTYYKTN